MTGPTLAADIRTETSTDFEAIAEVVTAAFASAAEARLVEAIRASDRYIPSLALVAAVDGQVVGHVLISHVDVHEELPGGDVRVHEVASLAPLAVAPGLQGRGVGSRLVREVTSRAAALGEPLVVLEGSPQYYSRFGFTPATARGISIHLRDWAPPEAAQVLSLGEADRRVIRGTVVYPPAFGGVI